MLSRFAIFGALIVGLFFMAERNQIQSDRLVVELAQYELLLDLSSPTGCYDAR